VSGGMKIIPFAAASCASMQESWPPGESPRRLHENAQANGAERRAGPHRHLSRGSVNAFQVSVAGPGRLTSAPLPTYPRGR